MLEAVTLWAVLAAGLLAGVASGLFGVGGGILMVPAALYLVPGTSFHDAKAVSLLVIVASAATGIWAHHRRGSVDLRAGLLLAAGGLGGALLSVLVAERIEGPLLATAFGVVLALTGARLAKADATDPRPLAPRARSAALAGIGALGGLLSGALGVGGGIVMVPGMVLVGIPMHLAVGTSLVAVLGNAIGATGAHLALDYGATLLAIGVPLAAGAVPGGYLGARLAHRLHADRLRLLFGVALVLVGLAMVIDALR